MDYEDEKYFNEQLIKSQQEYLNKIKERVKQLMKQAIQEKVYNYYEPNTYVRTMQLIECVDVHVNRDNELYVYVDNQFYYSAVDGSPQDPDFINYIINEGHDDGIGEKARGKNQYHRYEGRHFLEYAQELIDKEFNCDCEIILKEF